MTMIYYHIAGKLSREKTFANFTGLWLFAKVFSLKFWVWCHLARYKWAICESFFPQKFFSLKSFPLYGMCSETLTKLWTILLKIRTSLQLEDHGSGGLQSHQLNIRTYTAQNCYCNVWWDCDLCTTYHMSNSRECMGVSGEILQLHAVYKKLYFLLQVTRESVSVLQITWESVSGTASHARRIWACNEIEGSYDKSLSP